MILLLIYYKKVIGLDEDSRQLAIKIDKTVLENKIGSDEEWMFNFSGLISLFFKIKGIENLSDKFYRISESFNVGHHLIDFSFRK
jgi:hypothetical protein